MKSIDSIFKQFNNSIFSKSESNYKEVFNDSFLATESADLESFRNITANLEEFSNDDYIKLTKDKFRNLVGKTGRYLDKECIGTHPDFKHLERTNDIENHYAVSFFADIKNSTGLVLSTNDLVWTRNFKNLVLKTMTYFIQIFDGHVHRLQGDAIFGLFVWKDKCQEDAIIDALNAASFLLKFIEEQLNPKLNELGFESLKIRIGIDFGKEDKVIWSEYGIDPITEVTTTSIHTDLAAKLQSKASSNTIMIGDNIKEFLDLPDEFLSIKSYQSQYEKKEDLYIWNKQGWQYRMWVFNHNKYLEYFPYLNSSNCSLSCLIDESKYPTNLFSLDKGLSLSFIITHPYTIGHRVKNIKYEWTKVNRGKEAKLSNAEGKLPASSFQMKGLLNLHNIEDIILCNVKLLIQVEL